MRTHSNQRPPQCICFWPFSDVFATYATSASEGSGRYRGAIVKYVAKRIRLIFRLWVGLRLNLLRFFHAAGSGGHHLLARGETLVNVARTFGVDPNHDRAAALSKVRLLIRFAMLAG
jgi:hypothetical protein